MALTNPRRQWSVSRQLISGEIADHSRVTMKLKKSELDLKPKVAKKRDSVSRLSRTHSCHFPVSHLPSHENGRHAISVP